MSKERYSPEQVHLARQANLAEYLISIGVPLVKEGNRYRYRDDKKLVFTDNAFYWNGRNETGNAIDFLTKHLGGIGKSNLSFRDAMSELAGAASFKLQTSPKPLKSQLFRLKA